MRILLVAAAALVAPASAAAPPDSAGQNSDLKAECRTSALHQASPFNRADPVRPRKLGELPPATGYKAVLRTIAGCNAPLTVAEYQRSSGR